MTTETTSTTSNASQAETKRRGPKGLRPALSIERESPKAKITLEMRQATQGLIKNYALFLAKYDGFEAPPDLIVENILKNHFANDVLFQDFIQESAKKERVGAKAKSKSDQSHES